MRRVEPATEALTLVDAPTVVGASDLNGAAPLRREKWLSLKAYLHNPVGLIGAGTLLFMVLFSFLGPLIYHTNQISTNLSEVALRRAPHTCSGPTSRATTSSGA